MTPKTYYRATEIDPECHTAYGEELIDREIEDEIIRLWECKETVCEAFYEVITMDIIKGLMTGDDHHVCEFLRLKMGEYLRQQAMNNLDYRETAPPTASESANYPHVIATCFGYVANAFGGLVTKLKNLSRSMA